MSKYEPLWRYIADKGEEKIILTYAEIESVLGFPIDHSFLTFKKELTAYGYEAKKISMKNEIIEIRRIQ